MKFAIYGKTGCAPEIRSLEDWFKLAPPAQAARQWKPGRSAMEFARAWIVKGRPRVPEDIERLLLTCQETQGVTLQRAFAELKTQFRDTPRGPRNHDLLIEAERSGDTIVFGVEGKEREEFDRTLDQKIADATKKSAFTKLPARVNSFCRALFGRPYSSDLKEVRYQFLSGIAGMLVEANRRGAALSVFIVFQFRSGATPISDFDRNFADYTRFVRVLLQDNLAEVLDGKIYGPFNAPGSELVPAGRFLIGKITSEINAQLP